LAANSAQRRALKISRPRTWFDNRVKNPDFERHHHRRNAGAETELSQDADSWRPDRREYVLADDLAVSRAYIYESGKVTDGGANGALVGKYIAQVPKNRGSIDIRTRMPNRSRSFGVQFVGGPVRRRPEQRGHSVAAARRSAGLA
jgi:hypothetical protein